MSSKTSKAIVPASAETAPRSGVDSGFALRQRGGGRRERSDRAGRSLRRLNQTRLVGTRRDELKGGAYFSTDLRNVTDSGKRESTSKASRSSTFIIGRHPSAFLIHRNLERFDGLSG